jgi:hypothetical protein
MKQQGVFDTLFVYPVEYFKARRQGVMAACGQ